GTLIVTDCHASYRNLNIYGYEHLTVNHSRNFVDPISGATTNHIESMWQKLKQTSKARYGTARTTLDSHIFEFLWRKKYGNCFKMFLDHIREIFDYLN
ncbi:hypothetical protein H311_03308, partial [Anncaliia algerae PRA109]